jgi:tRNA pseudouridine55 synthase
MNPGGPSGLLVLHKPSGCTSHDCVDAVRQSLKEKRVGHCGTLDPIASGVLLVLVGSATVHQERYMSLPKTYWFRARLGSLTDTGDREGKVLPCPPYHPVPMEIFEKIVKSFVGTQWQTPPRFSAVKHGGKPLYEYARRGIEVPREPRSIEIYDFRLLSLRDDVWEGRLRCSRGTYVRTVVEDVAESAGTGAFLEALVRESVGPYSLDQSVTLDDLKQSARPQDLLRAN